MELLCGGAEVMGVVRELRGPSPVEVPCPLWNTIDLVQFYRKFFIENENEAQKAKAQGLCLV